MSIECGMKGGMKGCQTLLDTKPRSDPSKEFPPHRFKTFRGWAIRGGSNQWRYLMATKPPTASIKSAHANQSKYFSMIIFTCAPNR
jgi:hypothetical protein